MSENDYDVRVLIWSEDPNHPEWDARIYNALEDKTAQEWLDVALIGMDASGELHVRVTDAKGAVLDELTTTV